MSGIKNGGLDQYGAGLFEQQQFGIAGVKRVKTEQLSEYIISEKTAGDIINTSC